ncbi:fatty acid-binding protein, liver-like [Tubulanus polymorphus]|uniref:fatty acid-binding protein, liver-like n=1 Tax=Tubulanus polymorphus TaxID=672921 RepID=UPI003DA48CE6
MEAILGTWEVDPTSIDENQGKVMDAMGTPKEFQKMMISMKPRMTYSKNGDTWKVVVDGANGKVVREAEAKLGEEIEITTLDQRKAKVSMVWENDAMLEKTVVDGVEAISIRQPKGDTLLCTISIPSKELTTKVIFRKTA